ncbi:hypothetical protein CANCADRAFT_4441 [Tortispora caseinolytica NRRL Y-17796]|uniref:ATP phosphoribosyltransferase n=1 Tax=Tortispora caseinolytica NRRL Y-17796 TaxID=767744 RepID=A0A1E4TDI7_9ASCO|nr:hypothetical protein CANCADRAFT_4441 [Tortispora caseinolytica NRRL Y-17796]
MDLVNSLSDRLLFAVPKKGRLYEQCLSLLHGADVQFRRHNRLDIALSTNLQVALVFLPAADIPRFVAEGRVALGITGVDQVKESEAEVEIACPLNFGKCKLQVQVPKDGNISEPKQLIGKSVVTSFTHLATKYFAELEGVPCDGPIYEVQEKLKTSIKYVGGSVEAACALGLADGIVDLVESGETMKAAGLKAIATVLDTEAAIISSKKPEAFLVASEEAAANKEDHHDLVDLIIRRIRGVVDAQKYVLCTFNAPKKMLPDLLKVTPGRRAATVSPLEDTDWVAVSSMVLKGDIALKMDELERYGASDILVFNISNSRN